MMERFWLIRTSQIKRLTVVNFRAVFRVSIESRFRCVLGFRVTLHEEFEAKKLLPEPKGMDLV